MPFTEPLKEKWGFAFDLLDKDKDGIITVEEMYAYGNNLAAYYHVDEDQIDGLLQIGHLITESIKCYYGTKTSKTSLTRDEWITAIGCYWSKHQDLFKQFGQIFYKAVFNAMDLNKDGFVNFEEIQYYYKRFGDSAEVKNKAELVFKLLDANGDGKISEEEYVGAYTTYLADPDVTAKELPLY